MLLFRTVSEELSEAVTIIPVTQGLMSPWEPNSSSPPAVTFDPDPTTYDPWHLHLDLHRRSCPGFPALLPASSSDTANTSGSSRRSSSSSEAGGPLQDVDSPSDPPGCSRETSPCSSFKEEELLSRSRGDPDPRSSKRPGGGSQKDPVQVSVSDEQERSAAGSLTSSDGSSTPVASCSPSGSTASLHEGQNQNRVAERRTSNAALQTGGPSRKFSAPALRFTRGVSVGGVGSSTGVHQNQIYHPFPSRKAPRISEAARRLGMYSSF